MSRRLMRLIMAGVLVVGVVGLLYWPVQTRQGIDSLVTEHTVPLYLKIGRFLYRDLEYRHLAGQIVQGAHGDEARFLRIYAWVREHIYHGVPEALPIVDDHVWDIVIRGYGTSDQLADVLATLCAYAGIPADLVFVRPPGQRHPVVTFALVKIEGRWSPVDPYLDIIVRNAAGQLATREEILADPSLFERVTPRRTVGAYHAVQFIEWLPSMEARHELRPYRHQPFVRIWYEMRRGVRGLLGSAS